MQAPDLQREHPEKALVHAALAPGDEAADDFGIVALDAELLLNLGAEGGDVAAAGRPRTSSFR